MSRTGPVSALVLGAISRDLEVGGAPVPGGVVHHAGSALARLGASTRVVTSLRREDADELLGPLRAEGVEICARDSERTTTYRNDYSGARDAHEILALSDPIGPDDIPPGWAEADLVHLGPLHRRDLLPEITPALRGLAGIDVQGLVRERGPDGTRLTAFPRLGEFLAGVPIVKASEDELPLVLDGASVEAFMRAFEVRELLVTLGAGGSIVTTSDGAESVPAVKAECRHPAGAGDVFLTAYLYARVRGFAPGPAARVASRVSAAKIERGEVPKGFTLEEEKP